MQTLISRMGRTSPMFQLLLILFSCVPVQSEGCNVGWFGCKCQYQCHCKNNMECDVNGECVTGCDIDWFGTACQYVNLATLPEVNVTIAPRQTTTWLTDGDDTTCNEDGDITSIHISWNKSYPFTWLRMKVKNTSLKFKNVNLTFLTSQKETPTCINKQVSFIDSTRIDYRCEMTDTIIQLKLTGPALKSLCSLYISGGRNVALHQSAEQSSTYNEKNINFTASLAVDGNTTCNINDNSISHTLLEPKPSWSLRLDTPKVVNRFVIYNRVDCCMNRLKNFILTTFDINNKTLLTYQDLSPEAADIYTFPVRPHYPVSRIGVIPTDRDQKWDGDKFIVTICEIFMFGECMPGVWDLDCRHKCPEECPSWCQQDTGKCLSCLGHSDPPRCNTVCASGTFGINCQQNCSDNCYNNACDSVTGECDRGCNGYSEPPECTIALKERESSSMTFEAGIGVGIVIGAGVIVLILVVLMLIYRARHYSTTSNTRQERAPNQGTQLNGQNRTLNKETQLQSQGKELQNYNELNPSNEYRHYYKVTGMTDTDTGYGKSFSSSKFDSQASTYDTIDKY